MSEVVNKIVKDIDYTLQELYLKSQNLENAVAHRYAYFDTIDIEDMYTIVPDIEEVKRIQYAMKIVKEIKEAIIHNDSLDEYDKSEQQLQDYIHYYDYMKVCKECKHLVPEGYTCGNCGNEG